LFSSRCLRLAFSLFSSSALQLFSSSARLVFVFDFDDLRGRVLLVGALVFFLHILVTLYKASNPLACAADDEADGHHDVPTIVVVLRMGRDFWHLVPLAIPGKISAGFSHVIGSH